MAMDRTGHRLAGPAISMGAEFFNEDGYPEIDDEGFRRMAELMMQWHEDGTMIPDVWIGSAGSYVAANEQFVNAQVVFYMSGSWQIGQFANLIGSSFDWQAVPNPCGPNACTGMPGGAALVGIADTEHPEAVARVLDFLAQEEQLAEFYGRTLFIPGHLGLAESGVEFDAELERRARRCPFAAEVPKLHPTAYALQGYQYNRVVFDAVRDRLTQAFVGELTLEQALSACSRHRRPDRRNPVGPGPRGWAPTGRPVGARPVPVRGGRAMERAPRIRAKELPGRIAFGAVAAVMTVLGWVIEPIQR